MAFIIPSLAASKKEMYFPDFDSSHSQVNLHKLSDNKQHPLSTGPAKLHTLDILIEVLPFYTSHFSWIANIRIHFGIKIEQFNGGPDITIVGNCQNKH